MTCILKIGVLGINHKIANLPFREAIARGAATLCDEKAVFFPHPVVVLSTCNRTEIYFGGEDLALIHTELLQWLRGTIHEPFEHRLYSYFGLDCFRHLSCVAAGLDSAVLAETEIQAQVKTAYSAACKGAKFPSCMHYVFQKALKLGKLVRSQIEIDRAPSVFQAIWQLATLRCPIEKARILLVGYSKINRGVIHFLRQRHVEQVTCITRHPMQAFLAGVLFLGYEAIDTWRDYDLVICASGQDRYLISGASSRSQVLLDLSVPRNVDPTVGESDGVSLYNIEQINEWIRQKKSEQTEQIGDAYALIWRETIRLAQIYRQKVGLKTQYALDI